MDKAEFFIKLKQCITAVYNDIHPKEDLFEFGISLSQDTDAFAVCYNTYTFFANQLKECFLKRTVIDGTIIGNEIVSYNRWRMNEWEAWVTAENILVGEVHDMLMNIIQPQEVERDPENCKNNILDLFCNALLELREEGLFDSMNKNAILYLEKDDSFISSLMKGRVRKLLGEKYYKAFLNDMEMYPGEF